MFKHRLSKFSKALLFTVCLLFVGGSLQSCKDFLDDYKYDDTEPDWLGASIYAFLKEGTENCTYNHTVALIDSLGEEETLSHTGSKTLFVADDAAFEEFFKNNPWGVKSVKEMTKPQMKVLLYGSMLNNALLLDMIANSGADASKEGTCLRRTTSLSKLDTVPLVNGASFANHKTWPTYNFYWDAIRGKERKENIRLAMDGSEPMMVHFLNDYLQKNGIKVSDINFLFEKKGGEAAKEYKEGEVLIYGNKVLPNDVKIDGFSDDSLTVACKNGYVYRMDNVLLPPTNMAGELRNRKDLRIFSHLLDRFCIPIYDATLTSEYKERNVTSTDSVFRLRYLAKSGGVKSHDLIKDIAPLEDELLVFDPGENEYSGGLGKDRDMAAMFVPKDEYIYDFFANPDSAGYSLLNFYASDINVPVDYSEQNVEVLIQALDSIPQVNVAPFLNNLMKPSFINAVASKFDKITNDANEEMKLGEEHVDECIIANNGVIYILNKVFAPATYTAVTSPTLMYDNMSIMRNIVKQLRYDYYLLAMDAKYTFIVPDDGYFRYYDPVSFAQGNSPKMYEYHYDKQRPKGKGQQVEFWANVYDVKSDLTLKTDSNGIVVKEDGPYKLDAGNFNSNAFLVNRMTDLLDYLVVVHNNKEANPRVRADKMYYSTKGYGTIKIDATDQNQIKFYGGEQLETNTVVLASQIIPKDNGVTYNTTVGTEDNFTVAGSETTVDTLWRKYSAVPTPPRKCVYDRISEAANIPSHPYYEFFNLCTPNLKDLMGKIYTSSHLKDSLEDSIRYYSIFYTTNDDKAATKIINGVPFFNTFHYTVYVPSNESLKELLDAGFPQWSDVTQEANKTDAKMRAASLMRYINNFIRNHFQDNSVYCDKSPFEYPGASGMEPVAKFSTATIDPVTGRFYENTVKSDADNVIMVKDAYSTAADEDVWAKVVTTGVENEDWNVMCRDIVYTVSSKKPNSISTSSFSVIQPIDRVLRMPSLYGYDGDFVRFAKTGEKVDTMTVEAGKGGLAGKGDDCYLVAKCGAKYITLSETDSIKSELAYLLKPLDAPTNPRIERETKINDKLITKDGYLVKAVKNKYEFDIVEENGKKYKVKVDNAGTVISKSPFIVEEEILKNK